TGRPTPAAKAKARGIGPVSAARLRELASSGVLGASDLVWMEGTDALLTVTQFLALARGGLAGEETASPAAPPASRAAPGGEDPLPPWLADMARSAPAPQAKVPLVPDWLADAQQSERRAPSPDSPGGIPL